jgi:hypothetical protein
MRKIIIGCLAVALIGIVGGARGAPTADDVKATEDGSLPAAITAPKAWPPATLLRPATPRRPSIS